MKVMILNAEAGGNKGAEAMLEILMLKLLKEFEDIGLMLEISANEDYYKNVFLKRFVGANIQTVRFEPKKIVNPYNIDFKQVDYVIDIGGINFHDGSFKATMRNLIRFLPFVLRGKKMIFFTQDTGPALKFFTRLAGKMVMKRALAVFSRSKNSKDVVLQTFGVKEDKVNGPFPDATLVFDPKEAPLYTSKEEYIVLTPSAIMYTKYGEDYVDLFVQLYDKLSLNFSVIGLVHNFTKNDNSSDAKVLELVNQKLGGKMKILNKNVPTGELKALLSKAKFVISSRYHVVVGAVSKNVPAIAIGWNPKYYSFLNLYGKTDWNIDFGENAFQKIMEKTQETSFLNSNTLLSELNEKLKKEVESSFEILFKLMGK